MKNKKLLDLYTDYLLSSFSLTTATGLSSLTCEAYSHDQITRFLSQDSFTQKDYWHLIKSFVRETGVQDAVLAVDDFLEHKPHTKENSLVCYHFDHGKGKSVKAVNIINFLLISAQKTNELISIPVAFENVCKSEKYTDKKSVKVKRRSKVSKNQIVRERLKILTHQNQLSFKYVAWDSWYSSCANMELVVNNLKRHFVCPIKKNRNIAVSFEDKIAGNWQSVSSLDIKPKEIREVWIKGISFPVVLTKQVFTNKDDSNGVLYLVSDDISLDNQQIATIYHKRWKVEEAHKSLKQNVSLEKSPTKIEKTQKNHIFASFIAFIKLEKLKIKKKCNHFALKKRIYMNALKYAMKELLELKNKIYSEFLEIQ